jgi:hypothetical protein
MADSSYGVEIKLASKNGWFTPAEARAYYGRYDRSGYCVHWWGDGTGASNHDNIVNYMNNQAAAGNKSVNYVLSDNKMTLCVSPDNVAWCQESGNATEISVETQPTLGDEGYKKHGWLKDQLDQREGRKLVIHGHNFWFGTTCPGTISLDRIAQEADKWSRGVYDHPAVPAPVPATPPPPPSPQLIVVDETDKKLYTLANAKLVNFSDMSVIKAYPLDTPIDVSQKVRYNNMEFYRTVYSAQNNKLQGFLVGDLKAALTPVPAPVPPKPEWIANLRDIDDTTYWLAKDQDLIDITTGKPTGTKSFKKDESFVGSALTISKGVEYRITDYSFRKGVFNGVPIGSLTLTKPGVPDVPPVPTLEQRVGVIEATLKAIVAFLAKLGFKQN